MVAGNEWHFNLEPTTSKLNACLLITMKCVCVFFIDIIYYFIGMSCAVGVITYSGNQ